MTVNQVNQTAISANLQQTVPLRPQAVPLCTSHTQKVALHHWPKKAIISISADKNHYLSQTCKQKNTVT